LRRPPAIALHRVCKTAFILAWVAALGSVGASPAQKTVCTITINSADEREALQSRLPRDKYRFVELVKQGRPGWLAQACQSGVVCDALVISGHFDAGTEFYSDRHNDPEFLTVHEMERASCSGSCQGLFSQLKEVYLFGCNTLKVAPVHSASPEIARSLMRTGHSPGDAERLTALWAPQRGQSNRDRMRHVFKDVPVLYGFSSQAPLGRSAGPLLDRYLQAAPPGEFASGRASATLLGLFGPASMTVATGLTASDPDAVLRHDVCSLADEQPTDAKKLAFLHGLLQRDMAEVRLFLDRLEHYTASIDPAQRSVPEVAAALAAIAGDGFTRQRYLDFARDADEPAVRKRMLALAGTLGWLTPAQDQAEFVRLIADRMAIDGVGKSEVDLVCASATDREAGLARQLLDTGAPRSAKVAHAAVLACLGSPEAHARTVRALTSAVDDDVAVAQVYLRHRTLDGVAETRAVVAGIARMPRGGMQVRALDTLARQRVTDRESLQDIARLFPLAQSLDVQRAIAGVLIRADHQVLARAEIARTLRQHRLKSPDGSDVIDVLIRLLLAA